MNTQQTQVQTTESVQTETTADTIPLTSEGEGETVQTTAEVSVSAPAEALTEETSLVPAVVAVVLAVAALFALLKKKLSK